MSNVIFVKTRTMLQPNTYDGYKDYFRLAELSGYASCFVNEIDPSSDNTYIITPLNGEWNHGWAEKPRAQIILHDLEWRLRESDYKWDESALETPPGVARVWASDKWYAERIGAEYVPLGSHPGLVEDAYLNEGGYDVAMLAYLSGRRQHAAGQLRDKHGLTLAPNAWNPERDAILKGTTAMVHVHQHDKVATIAPLRFALAAAYKLPLISERVEDADLFKDVVLFAEYGALPEYAAALVRYHALTLTEYGNALHDKLCVSNTFKSFVDTAL